MIGRAAQGRPWIFREVAHYLATGEPARRRPYRKPIDVLTEHLHDHYGLYGEQSGVRVPASTSAGPCAPARGEAFRQHMNTWSAATSRPGSATVRPWPDARPAARRPGSQ